MTHMCVMLLYKLFYRGFDKNVGSREKVKRFITISKKDCLDQFSSLSYLLSIQETIAITIYFFSTIIYRELQRTVVFLVIFTKFQ